MKTARRADYQDEARLKGERSLEAAGVELDRVFETGRKVSYARVAAGIMNFPAEIETVLREIRALASKSAAA